jgi:hypothetical protein
LCFGFCPPFDQADQTETWSVGSSDLKFQVYPTSGYKMCHLCDLEKYDFGPLVAKPGILDQVMYPDEMCPADGRRRRTTDDGHRVIVAALTQACELILR